MALGDSTEFSPFNRAPLGVPGNPLDGGPMAEDAVRPRRWWAPGTRAPLQSPGRLESSGLTGVGGVPAATQLPQNPEQLLVPDVVSATDPAYTMHPAVQHFLGGLSRMPAADTGGSPWAQVKTKGPLRKAELLSGLQVPGLDLPYQDQGAILGR